MPEVLVKVTEVLGPRNIYIRTVRGESYYSLDEAGELLIQLTAAIERAIDPTPLPEPEPIMQIPRPQVVQRQILPKQPLEDLL